VCGTLDLSRHNNDKSTFLLRQCGAQFQPHMCISFNRANRIRSDKSGKNIKPD
jgi:hypothetical protein